MKKLFISLLVLSFCITSGFAQDSTQLAAWKSFKTNNPGKWVIRWNKKTGVPSALFMGKTRQFKGSPREIASRFLRQNSSMTKMKTNLSNLKFVQVLSHRGINDVKFQQTYKTIPVEGAEYMVHVLSDGSIDMINGTYYPKINVPVAANITLQQAISKAMQDLSVNVVLRGNTSGTLVIYPEGDKFFLTWKLLIPAEKPYGAWVYFIDASNGKILSKYNDIRDVTGFGNVYPTQPNISSITNVTLNNLDGTGYLRGSYANILNAVNNRAYSSSNTFNYSSTDTHFDEVNVYYHIDKFRGNYLSSLGFNVIGQITATVHKNTGLGPNNAWFDPSSGQLFFGDGTPSQGYYDFAKEDKVIYHEYTHAMTHSIVNIVGGNTESGAIDEGNSDYFAGSYTTRSVIGDYVSPSSVRDMKNPSYSYYSQLLINGNYYAEPHDGGNFWSATLWDLHNSISTGPSITDQLVYGALYRITSNATFISYRDAIIAEDFSVFNGAHINDIKYIFAQRGIGITVSIDGPSSLALGSFGYYNAIVTGTQGGVTYEWHDQIDGQPTQTIGTGSSVVLIGNGSGRWLDVVVEDLTTGLIESDAIRIESSLGGFSAQKDSTIAKITLPNTFSLSQNYPNPFNPSTEIKYSLKKEGFVTIKVYDVLGNAVATLVNEKKPAGFYKVNFDARSLSSGIYFYRITANGFTAVKKMILTK